MEYLYGICLKIPYEQNLSFAQILFHRVAPPFIYHLGIFEKFMRIEDLFQAYFNARKNKRNTINALQFEYNYESELFRLYKEIEERHYFPQNSICFINEYPVKREVFAADFRDRVVHHLIYNYIWHIFERLFIYDSYSCRPGKGTLKGIRRLDHFIRSCSQNYKEDCYILKMDIAGYFMNIDKIILYRELENVLSRYRQFIEIQGISLDLLLYLIRKVVFDDPTKNCCIKGCIKDWEGLPKDKSLFYSGQEKGLPIGNLTSQLFSNVYLNEFDHYMKYFLGCRYYGRYVDDFFVISRDKEFLQEVKKLADEFLKEKRCLMLHKKKVYFQHYSKGVTFLGAWVKPHRIYIKNKTKGNFHKVIYDWNELLGRLNYEVGSQEINDFVACANSYLGMMIHFKTKKLRYSAVRKIDILSFNWFVLDGLSNKKLVIRNRAKLTNFNMFSIKSTLSGNV